MNKTPKLRFKEFSGDWESQKLGGLLEFKNGINASKEQYGHGKKFINVLDILNNDYITYENIIGKVNIDDAIFEKYSVGYGDVVFQRSSETREEVGTANVYLDKTKNATFGGFIIRGKKVGEYDPTFMNKLLKTSSARKEITTKSGGSTRYNVGQETLSDVEVMFPKLKEQEKIASFLSLVDKKISLQAEKVEALKDYKNGMMQKIFSRELRFKDDAGRDYPEWEENKLGDIAYITMGQSPASSCYNEEYIGLPLIQGNADVKDRKTSPRLYTSEITKTCDIGDIIMSVRAPVGAISMSLHNACIGRGVCSIKPKYSAEYIYQFLLKYESKWSQVSQGSTFESVNSNDIKSLKIPFPNLDEQNKIGSFLGTIDRKIEKEQEKLSALNEYKKGLLQQMFV